MSVWLILLLRYHINFHGVEAAFKILQACYHTNKFIFSYSASSMKRNRVKYQKGTCTIIGINADELLIFGLIVNVYIIQYEILLNVKTFETIEFDDHFLVFILHEKADPNVFVWSSQLYDYYVYGLYTRPVLRTELVTSPKNICLKYNVFKC